MLNQQKQNGDGFKQFLYVHPQKLEKIPNFALIFFDWVGNHQLAKLLGEFS